MTYRTNHWDRRLANNGRCGEWERTHAEDQHFGIQLVVSHGWSLSAWHVVGPLAPLLFAVGRARKPAARWGPSFWWGAAISTRDLEWTKRRSAVSPIATVVLTLKPASVSLSALPLCQ